MFRAIVQKHGGVSQTAETAIRAPGLFAVEVVDPIELKASPVVKLRNGRQQVKSPSRPAVSLPAAPPSSGGSSRSNARRSTFRRPTIKAGGFTDGAEDIYNPGRSPQNLGRHPHRRRQDGSASGHASARGGSPTSATATSIAGDEEDWEREIEEELQYLSKHSFHDMHERMLARSAIMKQLVNSCYRSKELKRAMENARVGGITHELLSKGIDPSTQSPPHHLHVDSDEEDLATDNLASDGESRRGQIEEGLDQMVTDGKKRIDELFSRFAAHKRTDMLKDTAGWLSRVMPVAKRDDMELEEYEATIDDLRDEMENDVSELEMMQHMQAFYNKMEAQVRDGNIFEKDLQELEEAREKVRQVQAGTGFHASQKLLDIQNQVKELRDELLVLDAKEDGENKHLDTKRTEIHELTEEINSRQSDCDWLNESRRKVAQQHKSLKTAAKHVREHADARSTHELSEKLPADVAEKVTAMTRRLFEEESHKLTKSCPDLLTMKESIRADEFTACALDRVIARLEEDQAEHKKQLMNIFVHDEEDGFLNDCSLGEVSQRLDEDLSQATQDCFDLERQVVHLKECLQNMNTSTSRMHEEKTQWEFNIDSAAAHLLIYCSYPEADQKAQASINLPWEGIPSKTWHQQLESAWQRTSGHMELYTIFAKQFPEVPHADMLASQLDSSAHFAWEHVDKIWEILRPSASKKSMEETTDLNKLSGDGPGEMQWLRRLQDQADRSAATINQLQEELFKLQSTRLRELQPSLSAPTTPSPEPHLDDEGKEHNALQLAIGKVKTLVDQSGVPDKKAEAKPGQISAEANVRKAPPGLNNAMLKRAEIMSGKTLGANNQSATPRGSGLAQSLQADLRGGRSSPIGGSSPPGFMPQLQQFGS